MDTSTIATPAATEPAAASEPDVRTFRGRTLEAILPQIRAELGADAIVLRRREGLAGGVAGFFQRQFVEVDARAALPHERAGEPRNDRATAEGLSAPAVQALIEQASPFADALARATSDPGLYGPQPNLAALVEPRDAEFVADELVAARGDSPSPADDAPAAPADRGAAEAPVLSPAALAAEDQLVESGLSPALAGAVVAEAVAHGVPFAGPRALKRLVRDALARRLPVMAALPAGPRTLAFVGAGGAGKSSAVARLAAAYAGAGADVTVVALRAPDGGRALATALEPHGVDVIAAADAREARSRLGSRRPAMLLIDTPAAGPGDLDAVAGLAADVRALKASEVHLAVPATLSAAAGAELLAALAPLRVSHLALTHADQTARPGAAVELAVDAGRPLSYACSRERAEPADPAELARRLLP